MTKKFIPLLLAAGLAVLSANIYAGAMADEAPEPHDPKKKNAGEECKAANECQSHLCAKSGEKSVCIAPPVQQPIPPT